MLLILVALVTHLLVAFPIIMFKSGDVEAALKKNHSLPLSASQGKVRNHLIRVLNNLMNF